MDEINKYKTMRKTTDDFIKDSIAVHGEGTFIYTKVKYINNKTPVILICPLHGEFEQRPDNHLHGAGCPVCRYIKCHQETLHKRYLEYVNHVHEKFGDKFEVIEESFTGRMKDAKYICPYHGEFTKNANAFLQSKYGCNECANDNVDYNPRTLKTTEEWKKEAEIVHHGKYIYTKSIYTGKDNELIITCPIHGDFTQIAKNHLMGYGCPKCSGTYNYTTEEWCEYARTKQPDADYIMDKVDYKSCNEKVCMICPRHGEFWIKPSDYLKGMGCYWCGVELSKEKRLRDKEDFIREANIIHKNKYDYTDIEYKGMAYEIEPVCPIHGKFKIKAGNHISLKQGCPKCAPVSKLEDETRSYLNEHNIKYEHKYKALWLGLQHLDFYLPEYNAAIECQGEQHFKPSSFGGKQDKTECFNEVLNNDNKKRERCSDNNVKLFYYTNLGYKEYPYKVYEDLDELIKNIKNG